MPRARTASATPATSGASGPIDDEVGAHLRRLREVGDGGAVERVDGVQRRHLGDSGVAGRAVQRGDLGVEGERAAQGVFAGAAADDQNPHGSSLDGSSAPHRSAGGAPTVCPGTLPGGPGAPVALFRVSARSGGGRCTS